MNAYVELKDKRFTVPDVDRLRSTGAAVEMLRARPGEPGEWDVVAVVGVEKAMVTLGDGEGPRAEEWPPEPPPDVDSEE